MSIKTIDGYFDAQRKGMIQVAITNAIEGLIQPPEKPE